jgi:hypothetical protein
MSPGKGIGLEEKQILRKMLIVNILSLQQQVGIFSDRQS